MSLYISAYMITVVLTAAILIYARRIHPGAYDSSTERAKDAITIGIASLFGPIMLIWFVIICLITPRKSL